MDEKQYSKLELTWACFKGSTLSQLRCEDTFMIGIGAGLHRGLKYSSLSRGLKAGLTTMGVVSVAAGVMNVLQLRGNIKKATEGK